MRVSTSVRNIGISGFSCDYGEVSTAANPVNVIVYQKDRVPPLTRVTVNLKECSDFTLRYDMFIILELSNCLHLVAVHRSPRPVAMSAFFQKLQEGVHLQQRTRTSRESPFFICGDFNIDLLNASAEVDHEISLLSSYDRFQHVRLHTTDDRSLLDHVWSNLPPLSRQVFMQESF